MTKDFDTADFTKTAPKGPYTNELTSFVRKQLKKNDDPRLKSRLKLFFSQPEQASWELVFTPLVLPQVPAYRADVGLYEERRRLECNLKRIPEKLQREISKRWSGGVSRKCEAVTKPGLIAAIVKSFIDKSKRDMNSWIKDHGRSIKGTITALEDGDSEYPNSDPELVDDSGSEADDEAGGYDSEDGGGDADE